MTQKDKIYNHLKVNSGEWVSGTIFNFNMMISQYHTRIHELQKQGHKIEASTFTDENGFKSYRLILDTPVSSTTRAKSSHTDVLIEKLRNIIQTLDMNTQRQEIIIISTAIKQKNKYNLEKLIQHYEN